MEKKESKNKDIVFSEIVEYREIKKDVKFNIVDKTIIIEQKKGIFKKEYKIIEIIPIKEIEIENQAKTIKIRTKTKLITIVCYNESDKKKIVKEIERIKKGRKKFKLDAENLDRIISILSKAEKIATIGVRTAIKIKELKENKK